MSLPSQYVSVAELQSAPLGLSLKDIPSPRSVGPNAPTGAQVYEGLTNLLFAASSAADSYCRQVITATQAQETNLTEQGSAWIDRDGYLWFKTENYPIISVSDYRYGSPNSSGPPTWTIVSPLTQLMFLEKTMVGVPTWFPRRGYGRLLVRVTYLNGYANTFLSGASLVPAGSLSLPVLDLTGFVPGQGFTVFDLGNTESLAVDPAFAPPSAITGGQAVPGGLPLAAATQFDHTPVPRASVTGVKQPYDIRASAVPYDFSWAVLLICKSFIQERGTSALVMGTMGGMRGQSMLRLSDDDIPTFAKLTLDKYKAVV